MPLALTEEQTRVVEDDGDFLLLACPGSGKTFAAAARIGRVVRDGGKVAACSYTNVGADRIADLVAGEIGVLLGSDHYLGTLHGLLLRYVVFPFAHLLGAEEAPIVRAGDGWPDFAYRSQHQKRISVGQFRRDPDGGLIFTRPDRWVGNNHAAICAEVSGRVARIKEGLFVKRGLMSADDAMWVALRILREHPVVAKAVAGRFDELLVDEAQDTSELQLACLREIRDSTALRSLVLIGDLEQSIYSFQGASAAGCQKLADDCGLEVIRLAENHRSSQKLCDVAVHFCTRPEADRAVGDHWDCPIDPEVMLYPTDDPEATLGVFRERLRVHAIEPANAAVLARSETMIRHLSGQAELVKIEPNPKLVGRLAVSLANGTIGRFDVVAAQELVAYAAYDEKNLDQLDPDTRHRLRAATYAFIGALPPLGGDLQSWITATRPGLETAVSQLVEVPKHTAGQTLRSGATHGGHDATAAFSPPPEDLTPQTVHAIKGEDREAVMVVVRKPHASDPARQLDLFETALSGDEISADQEEERRVTYVALTRAERYCLLAVPDTTRGRKVAKQLEAIGFARI